MMIRALVAAIALLFVATPVFADSLSSMFGVYVYPKNRQTSSQQANDESVCYKSAKSKTGVDPANLQPATAPPTTRQQGGAVRGAAGGAAVGAAVGAIGGNAGTGAGVGAALGAVRGRLRQTAANNAEQHYAQANVQAQQSQKMNNFRRAFAACLESKGYTVK
ncbi:MAG TPA: glycine zipper family protein [Candidatus Cybelea sp.]|nr:glycine zipper family protein [Candidatus Cybelea sp.]